MVLLSLGQHCARPACRNRPDRPAGRNRPPGRAAHARPPRSAAAPAHRRGNGRGLAFAAAGVQRRGQRGGLAVGRAGAAGVSAAAHGMRARLGEQSVWIACLRATPAAARRATTCSPACAPRGARRRTSASSAPPGAFCADAVALSSELSPKTRLLGRSGLMDMAGAAAPATDEQLRALAAAGASSSGGSCGRRAFSSPGKPAATARTG